MRFSARNLLIVLVLFILFLTFTGAFFIVNETKQALDQAIKARDDFGLMIGTLVSYPICFLGDLEKYKDYIL